MPSKRHGPHAGASIERAVDRRRRGAMIFYTLAAFDVHKPWISAFGRTWPVSGFIGRVLLRDVGKRVYHVDGILQVENDEQRDARVHQEGAPCCPPRFTRGSKRL